MNTIQEKLLADGEFVNLLTSLVGVIADKLPSGGDVTEKYVDDRLDEKLDDKQIDVEAIAEEVVGNYDMSEKINDAVYDKSLVDEDRASEIAEGAIDDYDWYNVISNNEIATEDYVVSKIDEAMDDRTFIFLQEILQKCFVHNYEAWKEEIGMTAVRKDVEEREAKKKEDESEDPIGASQPCPPETEEVKI